MNRFSSCISTMFGVLAFGAALAGQGPGPGPGLGPGASWPFMDEGPVVKGHPFSAQTVTEHTQTLADGNRIVQRSEGAVYRDGEGRTRREHTLTGKRPLPSGPTMRGRQVITIDDAVAGKRYVIDPDAKTVQRTTRWNRFPNRDDGSSPPSPPGRIDIPIEEPAGASQPLKESLGIKTIDGIEAQGTRTTITIPAGQAGNDMPIEIVHERWISTELQVPVLVRFSDPRMGDRVHRLTGVVRGEPPPQLFAVPTGYKEVPAREWPMRQHGDRRVP